MDNEVKPLLNRIGLPDNTPWLRLGQGVSSSAFLLPSPWADGAFIVLRTMPLSNARQCSYGMEHRVLRTLRRVGLPVPRPLDFEISSALEAIGLKGWSLTSAILGSPLQRADHSLAGELGRVLSVLHSEDVAGWGPPDNAADQIVGTSASDLGGIASRFRSAALWPVLPLSNESRNLLSTYDIARIIRLESELTAALTQLPAVLNHADLYHDHILIADRHLQGVIDFGGSFIGSPAWDFAILGVFVGWELTDAVFAHYTRPVPREEMSRTISLLGLCFCLYRLNFEAFEATGRPAEVSRLQHTLSETLDRLS